MWIGSQVPPMPALDPVARTLGRLPGSRTAVYERLVAADEPLTPAQLEARTDLARSTVYRALDDLAEAGLAGRRIEPHPDGHRIGWVADER